MSTASQKAVSH